MDDESQPIKTDQFGFAKLSIPRGHHIIEPQLVDNDEDNDEDNHVFASTSTAGKQVFVTGPVLKDSEGELTRRLSIRGHHHATGHRPRYCW